MKETNICSNGARFTRRQFFLALILAAPSWVVASGSGYSQALNPPLALTGNYNQAAGTDILLLPQGSGWTTMPVASADSSGAFVVANEPAGSFTGWAATSGVVPLSGDFNGDGLSDIALLRRTPGWGSMPIAFATGSGAWMVTNQPAGAFAVLAANPNAVPLTGDFNGDGRTDVALIMKVAGAATIPVALSVGNGAWQITNQPAMPFVAWAAWLGVVPLTGDFNADGRTDIALLQTNPGWAAIPVALATASGTWDIVNQPAGLFAAWATTPGVVPLTGDFDADGRTDIALLNQSAGWSTVPVAFAIGNGAWNITNEPAVGFAAWATTPGVIALTGHFDQGDSTDVVLIPRTAGWGTVPVAFALGGGAWNVTNGPASPFAGWAAAPGVVPLTGDFDGDGLTDVALLRQAAGWASIPVAFAVGDGTWRMANELEYSFTTWATGAVPHAPKVSNCLDFSGFPDNQPILSGTWLGGYVLNQLGSSPFQMFTNATAGHIGLQFANSGLEILLPNPMRAMGLLIGTYAGPVKMETWNGAGGPLSTQVINTVNTFQTLTLTTPSPATRLTFIAGGNEGILVRMCLLR